MNYSSAVDYAYAFFLVSGILILFLSSRFRVKIFSILSVNFSLLMVFILLLEIGFFIRIFSHVAITPISISAFGLRSDTDQVETLDKSPWFKFVSNTRITSVGKRGTDFVYSWVTDSLGYKNSFAEPHNLYFDYLALGDSFTEGMGVPVENTWPTMAGMMTGKKIYNAGVQGYAASQFLGTLDHLQGRISFDGVIIGHLPTIYLREKNYLTRPKLATGGIESIRLNLTTRGLVLPQLLRLGSGALGKLSLRKIPSNYLSGVDLAHYSFEIPPRSEISNRADLENDIHWDALVQSYKNIAEYCIKNKKKLILMTFPHRYEIYFTPEDLGLRSIKETQYYVELTLLREELSHFGVTFVDTFPALLKHSSAKEKISLPYLIKDGHLSIHGNKIVAEALRSNL